MDAARTTSDANVLDANISFDQVGDRCTPNLTPTGGFHGTEVLTELSNAQCGAGACMAYHLLGDPRCTSACSACGGTETCAGCDGTTCVLDSIGSEPNNGGRAFCTCHCGAGGDPSLPLCTCETGMRCIADGEGGGGYCVPEAF
jgi:hypothetical protein